MENLLVLGVPILKHIKVSSEWLDPLEARNTPTEMKIHVADSISFLFMTSNEMWNTGHAPLALA